MNIHCKDSVKVDDIDRLEGLVDIQCPCSHSTEAFQSSAKGYCHSGGYYEKNCCVYCSVFNFFSVKLSLLGGSLLAPCFMLSDASESGLLNKRRDVHMAWLSLVTLQWGLRLTWNRNICVSSKSSSIICSPCRSQEGQLNYYQSSSHWLYKTSKLLNLQFGSEYAEAQDSVVPCLRPQNSSGLFISCIFSHEPHSQGYSGGGDER